MATYDKGCRTELCHSWGGNWFSRDDLRVWTQHQEYLKGAGVRISNLSTNMTNNGWGVSCGNLSRSVDKLAVHPFCWSKLDLSDGQFSERCNVDGSFFNSDAIPIIFWKDLTSPSLRLFFLTIGNDYFSITLLILRTDYFAIIHDMPDLPDPARW